MTSQTHKHTLSHHITATMIKCPLFLLLVIIQSIYCYIHLKNTYRINNIEINYSNRYRKQSNLNLYKVDNDITIKYNNNSKWSFYLLETKDLDQATQLASECFYKPRLVLNTSNIFIYISMY